MKRPQKVTRETRPSQYARKMYGKDKIEKIMDEEDVTSLRKGSKKKARTLLNKRLRQALKREDIPGGGAYRKVLDIEEE